MPPFIPWAIVYVSRGQFFLVPLWSLCLPRRLRLLCPAAFGNSCSRSARSASLFPPFLPWCLHLLCRRSWSIVSARCLILAGWCFGVQFCSRPACRFSSQREWIDSAFVYPLVHRAFIYRLRSADAFGACSCRHSACEVSCAAVHSSGIIVTSVAIPATWPAVVHPALLRYCSYIARLLAVGAVSRSRQLGRAATCPCCAKLHICASTARGWPLLPSLFHAACVAARVRSLVSSAAALWRLFLVAVSISVLAFTIFTSLPCISRER